MGTSNVFGSREYSSLLARHYLNQALKLDACRKMNSATSLGDAYKISAPTNAWEQIGAKVNEGPGKPLALNKSLVSEKMCSGVVPRWSHVDCL